MAVGVLVELPDFTQDKYDIIESRLTNGGTLTSLSNWPVEGVLCHIAGPAQNGWRIVDVWESEEAFKAFGEILGAINEELGWPAVQPQFFTVESFVKD